MGELSRVLARAAIDEVFRGLLHASPRVALRGYDLDEDEVQALSTPGPHQLALLGRAAAELGIDAASWDPTDAVRPGIRRTRPASPLDALAPVSVQLQLAPAKAPDGRDVWSIAILPPSQPAPPRSPGEHRPWLHVHAADGQVAAWLGPDARPEGPAPDPTGPRWAHRTDDAVRALAATVPRAADRRAALTALLAAVTGAAAPPEVAPASPDAAPASPPEPSGEITVIGLGITGVDQLTREAEAALRRADRVFTVDTSPAVRALLAARCSRVEPLFEQTYRTRQARLPTYLDIVARVLDAALDGEIVVLAVQGHPTVFSYAPVLLRDTAPLLGVQIRVQPGISAEDGLLAALALDPADHGIQAFEATDLLLRRRPVDPHVLTLIWQVGNLETRLHTARPSRPQRIEGLVRWLGAFFPTDHPVTAVALGPDPGVPTTTFTVPLARLPAEAARLHAATTLVIPPVGRRALADAWLARAVDDPAHLHAITAPLEPSSE